MTPALENFRDEILPAVAPEAAGRVYILDHRETGWPEPRETSAFTIKGRHIGLRDYLHETGQWRGWLPAIVFVDQPTEQCEALGLALHELSHALPVVELADLVEPTAEDRQKQEQYLLAWQKIDPTPLLQATPWRGHGAPFIRRALHLVYRAGLIGLEVGLPFVMDCGRYELSGLWRYRRALAAEPEQMINCTFQQIEDTAPPPEFSALFAADVAAWNNRKVKYEI